MKSEPMILMRFDSDEGKVFDWADLSEHMIDNEDGTQTQDHLYTKTIFIGEYDSISNYVEVDAPQEVEE